MSASFDLVHWEPVAGGLQVRAGARDLNYPDPTDVRSGVIYGYASDRTGTLTPGGEPPAEPLLAALDNGDGQSVTVTLTGADAGTTNTLYVRLLAGAEWAAAGVFAAPADGVASLTVTLAKGSYWAYAVSDGSTGRSASRPVSFTVTSADSEHYAELRRVLRERLLAAGLLAAKLSPADAVYLDRAPESAAAPRIVFTEGRAKNTDGGKELYYTLTVYAAERGLLDSLCELARAAVVDAGGFETAGWSVREVLCTGLAVRVPEASGGERQLYAGELSCTLFAYERGVWTTLALGESTLTLPPLRDTLELSDSRWQAAGTALSGEKYVYDRGAGSPVAALGVRAVNEAEKEGLRAFFQEVACGMQNAFVLSGIAGGPWQARFARPQIGWTRGAAGTFALAMELELRS